MRANEYVDLARFNLFDNLLLLLRSAKTGDHLNIDRELRKPLLERLEVLEAQYRCRCEYGYLLAILNCFECSAHGNFSLAVTDIATQQTIHRGCRFHVLLDGFDCG